MLQCPSQRSTILILTYETRKEREQKIMIKKIPMSLTLIKSKDYFENANISLGNILMLPLKIMLISYDPI